MKKASALPVRLDTELKDSLSHIANETGLSVSALVRMLVQTFVDEYERNGGRVSIPPQWKREDYDYWQVEGRQEHAAFPKVAESDSTDET